MAKTNAALRRREFIRSQRYAECQARGYHVHSGRLEAKILGGSAGTLMELCAYCDVWVLPAPAAEWKDLIDG